MPKKLTRLQWTLDFLYGILDFSIALANTMADAYKNDELKDWKVREANYQAILLNIANPRISDAYVINEIVRYREEYDPTGVLEATQLLVKKACQQRPNILEAFDNFDKQGSCLEKAKPHK